MFEYRADIEINRMPEDVFEFVTQCENIPRWAPAVIEARRATARPFGAGTRIMETVSTPLGQSEVKWQVTAYEANARCTYVGESFLGTTGVTFTVSAADDGTLLSAHGTGHGRGVFRLLEPILERVALRERKRLLLRIKKLLEAQESQPQP